jgi:hypothetical protein
MSQDGVRTFNQRSVSEIHARRGRACIAPLPLFPSPGVGQAAFDPSDGYPENTFDLPNRLLGLWTQPLPSVPT